jgi:hypothetical protein
MDAKPEETKSNGEGVLDKIKNFLSGGNKKEAEPTEENLNRAGIVSKVENFLTGGYSNKEDLRELDKALRERYFSEMNGMRHRWEKVYLEVLDNEQSAIGKECKKVIQTIDRLSFAVNRADYGYAPLFDRVDEIREPTLKMVLEYDKSLIINIEQLGKDIDAAEASLGQFNWPQLRANIVTIRRDLSTFDEAWQMRKQSMTGK